MEQDFEKLKPEENGITVCTWCNKELSRSNRFNGVSHGVCEECDERVFGEFKRKKTEAENNKLKENT